jgi:hypothetical protein
LIDAENAIIVDVEATTAIRQAEVLAAKRMIERSMERFDLYPARLMGDSAYGSAEMIGWLVYEHGIVPHVTVFTRTIARRLPELKTQRQERFAQALAKGMTADAAYVEAGYKRNRGNASTLKAKREG